MTNLYAGIRSINPASGEVLEEFAVQTESEMEACLERSLQAANAWRETSFAERSTLLLRIANLLRKDRQRLARDITQEMGKPIAEAEAEVDKCVWNCRYVAEMGAQWLRDEPAGSSAAESYISYLPLGVVLAVMPWNFPLWQVFRFAAPALMAGNAVLLKHAPNVTRCAINIEDVGLRAGLLPGLLQNLIVPVDAVPALIRDDRIAAVTLTGSPRAGAVVAAI
ncbi:MAG: aldehyde dehydrogenase family protein, partial [Bryocella sp.]